MPIHLKRFRFPVRGAIFGRKLSVTRMQVQITSESSLRNPRHFFTSMLNDMRNSRVLAEQMLLRNLRNAYRQSVLGYVWAFLPSLGIALAFGVMGKARVLNIGSTDVPYVAYVIISVVLWQTFADALNAPLNALVDFRSLLARINFPREAMLLAKFGEVLINFSMKAVLIGIVLLWYKVPVSWSLLLAPLAVLALILFGTFLGLLLAPLSALYKDISKGLPLILLFWMFMTPVVFPMPKSGVFALVVQLNPVTPLLVTARELITSSPPSQLGAFFLLTAIAFAGNVAGLLFYRLAMPYIAERV